MSIRSLSSIALLLFLGIPIIILVTKIDMSPKEVKDVTVKRIKKLISLPAFNKKAFHFNEEDEKCKKELEEIIIKMKNCVKNSEEKLAKMIFIKYEIYNSLEEEIV